MKKLIAVLMCLLAVCHCVPTIGMPAVPADEGLSIYPSEKTLPMYSANFDERLWVYWDGMQVPAAYFDWSSSDTSVLTVTQSGYITPVSPGEAVVTVTDGDSTAQCTVTVVESEEFTMIGDLEYVDLDLPYYSEEVGIGPLCGGEPVILKRFILPPSCSQDDPPDPNDLIPEQGWVYTYANIYRFHAEYGHSYVFTADAPENSEGAAQSAYLSLYDCYFYLWSFDKGTNQHPYGTVTLDSYEDGYFYVVVTPISHTADGGSGYISFHAYDVAQPYAPSGLIGDVDCNDAVNFADVALLYQYVLGSAQVSEQGAVNSDVDGIEGVSFADVSALYAKIIAG